MSEPWQVNQYDPVLVQLGSIGVTQHWVVTPAGSHPLGRTQWLVSNNVYPTESTPTWAIILAIVLFPIGLLCLLAKERGLAGYVQVSVMGPGLHQAAQIPVQSHFQIADIEHRVNYIRTLSAMA
jgi:hypothetical protein